MTEAKFIAARTHLALNDLAGSGGILKKKIIIIRCEIISVRPAHYVTISLN